MYKSFLLLDILYRIGEEMAGRKHREEPWQGLKSCTYTVRNVLKGHGEKAYHKYRVQNMTDDHKATRVKPVNTC